MIDELAAPTQGPAGGSARAGVGPTGINFGWYNVAIAVLLVTLTVGATSYSFGLFVKPAAAELGLSRASTNIGLILFHMGSLIANPVLGYLYDRTSYRMMLRIAGVLFMIGMVGAGLAQDVWLIGLCIAGPLAFGTVGSATLPGVVLAARWFSDRRTRAITIIAMGTSFGGLLIFPTMALLLGTFGWRSALIIAGLSIGTIVLLFSFLQRPFPDESAAPGSPRAERAGAMSPLAILSMPAFWKIAIPAALMMGIDQTMLATVTPYMQDRGMTLAMASAVMVATTVGAIAGKLLIAWIGDSFDLRILLAATAVCGLLMTLLLYFDPSYEFIVAGSMLTGIAIGGTFPLASAIVTKYFGAASTGTALGLTLPMIALSASGSLYFIGATHDRAGNYQLGFLIFGVLMGVAGLLCALIPHGSQRAEGQS